MTHDGLDGKRAFDHVLIVMFEHEHGSYVLQNPFMRRLAKKGIELSNFYGVMHPSQTNHIASHRSRANCAPSPATNDAAHR